MDFWRAVAAEFLASMFFLYFSIMGVTSAIEAFSAAPGRTVIAGSLHSFVVRASHATLTICK